MVTIVVTTAADVIDSGDGKTSLREAIAEAAGKGPTEIDFDPKVFDGSVTLNLAKTLEIAAGTDVVIDGSSGQVYAPIKLDGAEIGSRMLTIKQGASVTLRDLQLDGAQDAGADGTSGTWGQKGKDGVKLPNLSFHQPVPYGDGGKSGDGAAGSDAPLDTEAGGTSAGGIYNSGSLVLERVTFSHLSGLGGYGGDGGRGGIGGDGGMPQQIDTVTDEALWESSGHVSGQVKNFGYGGDGGKGGNGAPGGKGGDAAGAIFNDGTIVLRDVDFVGNTATAGNGGNGGDGGSGGDAGRVYDDSTGMHHEASLWHAGLTGGGGDGGAAGNGGSAASALLNKGSVRFDGAVARMLYGEERAGVAGAFAGQGGTIGLHPVDYSSGMDGKAGPAGTVGAAGALIGVSTTTVASTFIVLADKEALADHGAILDRSVIYVVKRIGDNTAAADVHWSFTGGDGVTAADFVGGIPKGGDIHFDPYTSFTTFAITLNDDKLAEHDEHFTVTLSTSTAGAAVGWTASSSVTIQGDLPDPISGTSKDDPHLNGTSGDDTINGLAGDDTLNGKGGADHLDGGSGSDTASYADAKEGVTASLVKPSINTGEAKGDTFSSIENLKGSAHADILVGNDGKNTLEGRAGNDTIDGGGGADTLIGGQGADTYYVDNRGDKILEDKAAGADIVFSSVTFSLGQYIENLTLIGSLAINATGNSLDNDITGNSGVNRLIGGKGDDDFYVQTIGDKAVELKDEGHDRVFSSVSYALTGQYVEDLTLTGTKKINATGNDFSNTIVGNAGDNVVDGGKGTDKLTGGSGQDIFMFDTILGSSNVDVITDFSIKDDTIRLANAVFKDLAKGALDDDAFHIGMAAADAQDRIIYNAKSGALLFDADGAGGHKAVQFATIEDHLSLTHFDVTVV